MSEIIERITVEGEFVTVSLIVWRPFRRPMPGLVEQILDINPGLGELGAFLMVGAIFDMLAPTPREPAILALVKVCWSSMSKLAEFMMMVAGTNITSALAP